MQRLKVKRLAEGAKLPTVAHPGEDLGYDVFALEDTILPLNQTVRVRTGIAMQAAKVTGQIRNGLNSFLCEEVERLGLIVKDRSSMTEIGVFTRGGVIDAGFTGEIVIFMTSTDKDRRYDAPRWYGDAMTYIRVPGYEIKAGDKIAQLLPVPVLTGEIVEVDGFEATARGSNGFGSSGRQ